MGAEAAEVPTRHGHELTWVVGALAGLHLLAWWLATAPVHTAPSPGMAESLALGPEWVLGSFRNPPLLSWLSEAFWRGAGYTGIALLGALPVALTYPLVWQLGKRLLLPAEALTGVMLSVGIFFFTWPTGEFDVNALQMPLWTALVLLAWDCSTSPNLGRWLLLGAVAGLGCYAAYSVLILLVAIAGWMAWDAEARRAVRGAGPWLGLTVLGIVVGPHLYWLITHAFLPLTFARSSASGLNLSILEFPAALVLACVPALGLLAVTGWLPLPNAAPLGRQREDRFLLYFVGAPVLISILVAIFLGTSLTYGAAAPMITLLALVLARLARPRIDPAGLRRLAAASLVLLVAVPIAWAVTVEVLPRWTATVPLERWPQRAIAREVDRLAVAETGGSARVIAGNSWLAGLAALTAPSDDPDRMRPKVLVEGDRRLSPYVTDRDMNDTVVIVADAGELSPALNALWRSRGAPGFQRLAVPIPGLPDAAPIVLRVAVLTPVGASTRLALLRP